MTTESFVSREPNEFQKKILTHFRDNQCYETEGVDGRPQFSLMEYETLLLTYKNLEKTFSVSKPRLQIEVRELRDMGFLELSPAVDQDDIPSGSGWMLTGRGVKYINEFLYEIPFKNLYE